MCSSWCFIVYTSINYRNIQAPIIAKFSHLLIYAAISRQDRTVYYHKLLKQYGSPLRIATDQLIFSDEKSWDDIYGQSSNPCLKDPSFYGPFTVTGAVNVLNATHRPQASRIRRLLSHGFAKTTILQSEEMIAQRVDKLINVAFRPYCDGSSAEVGHKIHEHYLDIISHLSFGRSFDCVSGFNFTACNDVSEFLNYIPVVSSFPLVKYLPVPRIREGRKGIERL